MALILILIRLLNYILFFWHLSLLINNSILLIYYVSHNLITPPKDLNDELADLLNDFEDFVQTSEENKENLPQPIDVNNFDFN